ncbi:RsmB/NOP family class I SAM-dependent RNA methyltransferase [Candidatus Latescibacterota bacterium]
MAVRFLDPQPGERLLDLCAAPGGKTTLMAQCTGDRADITAVDINAARLGLVTETAGRLGFASIRCVEGDAVTFRSGEGELFDRVLCDVPCTGTAVFSKRPDMKWRRSEGDIARMVGVQRAILNNAYALAKPGGVIVYSTCTLEYEENEDIVAWFAGNHPVEVERADGGEHAETTAGSLILPHRMNGIGGFAAKLRKKR